MVSMGSLVVEISPFVKVKKPVRQVNDRRTSDATSAFWTDQPDIDWSDDVNLMVVGLDREGKVVQWSERARELTDFVQKELRSYSFTRHLVSHPFGTLVDSALKRTWAGEDVGCFQIPFFTKSGAKLQLVVKAYCSSCGSSEYMQLKATVIEGVAPPRAGAEKPSKAKPRADDGAVMTVTVDLDGLVTKWDAGAQQISGFTQAEMIGNDFVNTLIPAIEREPLEDAFMQSLMCKEYSVKSAIPVSTKGGKMEWLKFCTVPQFRSRGGQLTMQLDGVTFVGRVASEPAADDPDQMTTCDSLPSITSVRSGASEESDKRTSADLPTTCGTLETLVEFSP